MQIPKASHRTHSRSIRCTHSKAPHENTGPRSLDTSGSPSSPRLSGKRNSRRVHNPNSSRMADQRFHRLAKGRSRPPKLRQIAGPTRTSQGAGNPCPARSLARPRTPSYHRTRNKRSAYSRVCRCSSDLRQEASKRLWQCNRRPGGICIEASLRTPRYGRMGRPASSE